MHIYRHSMALSLAYAYIKLCRLKVKCFVSNFSFCFVSFRSVSFRFVPFCFCFVSHFTAKQARIQRRGPGVRTPPPLRFVRGGVLCSGLMGGRGGPTVVFPLLLSIFFWLASLASIIETYYMYTYFKVQCSVWNDRRHLLSIFSLFEQNPTSNPLLL